MNDQELAKIARELAEALKDVAYTRKDEDKKRVTMLHLKLLQAVKEEGENDGKGAL
jgi:hypothetical protein